MAGFDNGTIQSGVFFQAKQFGSILRGFGPPVPQAGVVGDLYIDVQTWNLFEKRSTAAGDDIDPWGHYLFVVPAQYRASLKWFSTSAPQASIGVTGDYCLLWGGYANYGMQPSIYGPKQTTGWPESGEGGTLPVSAVSPGTVLPVGLLDEGAPIAYSTSTQLIATGLTSEVIFPLPVTINPGDPVQQLGLPSGPAQVAVALNPLYTAEDVNEVAQYTNIVPGEQNNVSISPATGLVVPPTATYAVITAIGGPLYATYDGTVPSPTNYAITLQAGASLPVAGANTLAAIRVFGTQMSVSYWN